MLHVCFVNLWQGYGKQLLCRLLHGFTEGALSEATALQSLQEEPPGSITIKSGVELEVPWLQLL